MWELRRQSVGLLCSLLCLSCMPSDADNSQSQNSLGSLSGGTFAVEYGGGFMRVYYAFDAAVGGVEGHAPLGIVVSDTEGGVEKARVGSGVRDGARVISIDGVTISSDECDVVIYNRDNRLYKVLPEHEWSRADVADGTSIVRLAASILDRFGSVLHCE